MNYGDTCTYPQTPNNPPQRRVTRIGFGLNGQRGLIVLHRPARKGVTTANMTKS